MDCILQTEEDGVKRCIECDAVANKWRSAEVIASETNESESAGSKLV